LVKLTMGGAGIEFAIFDDMFSASGFDYIPRRVATPDSVPNENLVDEFIGNFGGATPVELGSNFGPPPQGWGIRFGWVTILLCFAVIPFYWLLKERRAGAYIAGVCRKCGYDLCATPNRFPECGTIPPTEEVA
jgi:hypothetical protein